MNTQTQTFIGARTFVLGMLAGASIVAGGLVLARGHNLATRPAVIIQTDAPAAAVVNAGSAADRQTRTELPAAIDLPRAVVVGHRLKIMVLSDSQSGLSLASSKDRFI